MLNQAASNKNSTLQRLLSGSGSAMGFRWFILVLLPVLLLLAISGQRAIAGWERDNLTLAFLALVAVLGLLFLLTAYIRQTQLNRLRATQRNMVFGLANLAEMRDPDTGKHLERTRGYGVILADTLRRQPKYRRLIDDRFIANLYDAAPCMTWGKLGFPIGCC